MQHSPLPHRRTRATRGVALIIVLAFVVLLAGVVVALLSRALSERQISNSSAIQTRADLFAQGATNTILGDLEQEIAAGSVGPTTPSANATPTPAYPLPSGVTLYVPATPASAVPAQVISNPTPNPAAMPNLVKRSTHSLPFYPATGYDNNAKTRAANVSTLTPSQNGRSISPARWNKALLLPKLTPSSSTDFTPTNATAATASTAATWTYAPDWVLVARDGSNPTVASSSVVGRYSYMIYNEGGLLDANVAGYPAGAVGTTKTIPDVLPQYKGALSYADLTQLTDAAGNPLLTQQQVDQIVGWRNYASAGIDSTQQPAVASSSLSSTFPNYTWPAAAADNYLQSVFRNGNGFLKTTNPLLINGQTDKGFTSRQELINLFQSIAGTNTATAASMQNALQYLGTFSRGLSQPSYVPLNGRPKTDTKTGSNSAAGNDDLINPSFLAARVLTTVAGGRNDGSDLVAGEPLVKKRFLLHRLAWLTYKGPISSGQSTPATSAAGVNSDPDIQVLAKQLHDNYGLSWTFLQQGTAANVYRHFGLAWVTDTRSLAGTGVVGDNQSKWVYNHTATAAPTVLPNATGISILRLSDGSMNDVVHANREPDFFELLKAGIAAGSKAKPATVIPTATPINFAAPEAVQTTLDSTLEYAVIQVGANIIDQYDLDGFPTRILFNSAALPNVTKEIAGVENLPYFYRVRTGEVQGVAPAYMTYTVDGSGVIKNGGTITNTGYVVLMQFPEIWNPHDANSPRCAIDPATGTFLTNAAGTPMFPTSFRLVADTTDPDHVSPSTTVPTSYQNVAASEFDNTNPAITDAGGYISNSNSRVYYSDLTAAMATTQPFTAQAQLAAAPFPLFAENTALTFSINEATTAAQKDFFREPTMLLTGNSPVGSNLQAGGSSNMLSPTATTSSVIPKTPDSHANIRSGTYLDSYGGVTCVDGNHYLGIYLATLPGVFFWRDPGTNTPTAIFAPQWNALGKAPYNYGLYETFRMQYDTTGAKVWATYDTKFNWALSNYESFYRWNTSTHKQAPDTLFLDGNDSYGCATAYDPRTSRFGMPMGFVSSTTPNAIPGSAGVQPPATPSTALLPLGWLDTMGKTVNTRVLMTQRPDFSSGFTFTASTMVPSASGWPSGNKPGFGLISQNSTQFTPNGQVASPAPSGTAPANNSAAYSYTDPDRTTRRGMGAYVSGSTTLGLPLATAMSYSNNTPAEESQIQSRPIVLNRPFRSVAELGYVFSGTPWKNLDFFTVESGDASLLDLFTLTNTDDAGSMVAGRVDLNTRQVPVLQALLSGAYTDEQYNLATPPDWKVSALTSTQANAVANALVSRSTATPLTNVAELAGRFVTANSYDGFSNDLGSDLTNKTVFGQNTTMANIQRLREAPVRVLSECGQTRVWNLLIDVVAQSGRYPASANNAPNPLAAFTVEGEQRYWVHVAIDRYTGQVLDKQIEVVKE